MASKRLAVSAAPVAEGVRFRVGSATALAVRRESKDIGLRIRRERRPFMRLLERAPFTRGMARFVRSFTDLLGGISESVELEPQRATRGSRFEQSVSDLFQIEPESLVALGSGLLIPFILIGLVVLLPMAVQRAIFANVRLSRAAVNVILCVVRVFGLLLSLGLCARLRPLRRLCMYQGAINKVLNAYEANRKTLPSVIEAEGASRVYRVSDAAFCTLVISVCMVVFSVLSTNTLPVQLLVRLMLTLVIAGLVNEPVQWMEHSRRSRLAKALRKPYMALERLFVQEPHPQMIEVAVHAFNAAKENDA